MTKFKKIINFIIVFVLTVIISIVLLRKNVINIQTIIDLDNELQYNLISVSATIGGFLFTGISILIAVLDKDRIKRLWDNNYLDNLYRTSFLGIISNITTIIVSFIVLLCNPNNKALNVLVYIEIISLILGVVFFIWCVLRLMSLIIKLKSQ